MNSKKERIPQFYGIWKVHKDKSSVRPIISCCGSHPQAFSTYVDYWLKKIVRAILPSYLPNVESLIDRLEEKFPNGLPAGARLFSIDAVVMYSNVDTEHDLQVVRHSFTKYENEIPLDTPTEFLMGALEIIMKENIFQFGDTHWLQKIGCAMGTSAAVNYAYLYVGLLEMDSLMDDFKECMPYYRRFIDDGIGVWLLGEPDAKIKFDEFFAKLNEWGRLRWTCTGFTDKLQFMDLTVSIDKNNKLHYKTFQKEMNLYLYIPPCSAHPPTMIKGLIFGRLRAYYRHNTDKADYYRMACLLAQRLVDRGWSFSKIKPIFKEANDRITGIKIRKLKPKSNMRPIFIHTKFHPRAIQRNQFREIFDDTLGKYIYRIRLLSLSLVLKTYGNDYAAAHCNLWTDGLNPSDFL